MRNNYAKIRQRLAIAISRELVNEEGAWPDVKAKVRKAIVMDRRCLDEVYQLADAAAAAVLDCD